MKRFLAVALAVLSLALALEFTEEAYAQARQCLVDGDILTVSGQVCPQ